MSSLGPTADISSSRPDGITDALALLIRYTRARVRSIREARTYLERRGIRGTAAEEAIRQCGAKGFLDDAAAARLWAAQWVRQGWARAAISMKLEEKGFLAATIGRVLQTECAAGSDAARARQLIADWRLKGRGTGRRTMRDAGFERRLAARGFEPEVISQALARPAGD